MTFLRIRRQKEVALVESRPVIRHCWLCAKALGHSFTSVQKDGRSLYVHFACRPEAARMVAGAIIVESQPDSFNLPIG